MGPLPSEKPATPGYKRQQGLTLAQQHALELPLQSKSDQATADALNLHRVTVTKWRNHAPAFRAAPNLRRRELWAGTADGLQALADKALEALAQDLQRQQLSARTALQVLRLTGLDRSLARLDLGTLPEAAPGPADLLGEDPAEDDTEDLPLRAALPPDTRRALQDLLRACYEAERSPLDDPQAPPDSAES